MTGVFLTVGAWRTLFVFIFFSSSSVPLKTSGIVAKQSSADMVDCSVNDMCGGDKCLRQLQLLVPSKTDKLINGQCMIDSYHVPRLDDFGAFPNLIYRPSLIIATYVAKSSGAKLTSIF